MSRALWLIIIQNMLIFTAFSSGRVHLSLYALNLGASSADVGIVLALLYLVPGLLSWPIGLMADRMGARWLLVAGRATQTVAMMVPFFHPSLVSLYIASIGIGVGVGFSNVLGQNLVGVLSTPEARARNFGNYSMVGGSSNLVGPFITGFAIDHIGFAWSAMLGAGMAALALAITLTWGAALPRGKPQEKKSGGTLAVLKEQKLRRVLYIGCINQVGVDCFVSFMPVYAHGIGLSASVIGTALAAMAAAMLMVRVGLTRIIRAVGERTVMLTGFVVASASFFVLPLLQAALLLIILSFVVGLYIGVLQPIIQLATFNTSPPGRGAEAMGLRLSINNMTRVFAPLVFGATARAAGMAPLFMAVGLLMCLGAYISRKHENSRRSP